MKKTGRSSVGGEHVNQTAHEDIGHELEIQCENRLLRSGLCRGKTNSRYRRMRVPWQGQWRSIISICTRSDSGICSQPSAWSHDDIVAVVAQALTRAAYWVDLITLVVSALAFQAASAGFDVGAAFAAFGSG